jgi:hypothetical protein
MGTWGAVGGALVRRDQAGKALPGRGHTAWPWAGPIPPAHSPRCAPPEHTGGHCPVGTTNVTPIPRSTVWGRWSGDTLRLGTCTDPAYPPPPQAREEDARPAGVALEGERSGPGAGGRGEPVCAPLVKAGSAQWFFLAGAVNVSAVIVGRNGAACPSCPGCSPMRRRRGSNPPRARRGKCHLLRVVQHRGSAQPRVHRPRGHAPAPGVTPRRGRCQAA